MTLTGGKIYGYISIVLCIMLAQSQVVSAKKLPQWLSTMQADYIIVSAEDASLEKAKEKAMDLVRAQIMNSIAQHVTSASQSHTTEEETNNQFSTITQYTASLQTESVDYPFLSGISPSMVEDSYVETWKKNKQTIYRFHVKYPYTQQHLQERVQQFLDYENNLQEQMDAFVREDFAGMRSLEQMLQRKADLKVYQSSLPKTDSRREQCDQVQLRYDEMIRSVRIAIDTITREQMVVALLYGDNVITYNKAPKLQSECLMEVASQLQDGKWKYTYNFQGCYPDEMNKVTLSLSILGKRIVQEAYIK